MSRSFDIKNARSRFPALQQDQTFLDNAGGSQALDTVIDSITQYLSKTNVQLGASYHTGRVSSTKFTDGYAAGAKYINASPEEIVIGSATTQLFMNLSYSLLFPPESEIVLTKAEHETNVKPWLHMADRLNLKVKWWVPDGPKFLLTPENLEPLLSERTKFVACTHVSNILGGIHDVKAIADAVHNNGSGALFCVDGVSYAPHRQIDVKKFGVDFYAFSWYKVYGPHVAQLYASTEAQKAIKPLTHYFNPTQTLQDKLGLAGSSYEAVQSIPEIVDYLSPPDTVFPVISDHEEKLQSILLDFLNSRDDITVLGAKEADSSVRVPTISFSVKGKDSKSVVEAVDQTSNFGIRWGHFYSKRLCDEVLGLGPEGVVRVSMVHYNTEKEIEDLVDVLKNVLT